MRCSSEKLWRPILISQLPYIVPFWLRNNDPFQPFQMQIRDVAAAAHLDTLARVRALRQNRHTDGDLCSADRIEPLQPVSPSHRESGSCGCVGRRRRRASAIEPNRARSDRERSCRKSVFGAHTPLSHTHTFTWREASG